MKKRVRSVFSFSAKQIAASDQYTCQCCAQFRDSNTDYVYGTAVENDDRVITGGDFRYTMDFDPGFEGEGLLKTEDGLNSAYISKLNSDFSWQ